jgi:hypothetical protein
VRKAALLEHIWAVKRLLRCRIPDLTVLSHGNDPYLLSDGRAAQWFAEQVTRFIGPTGTVHLRGLFYLCVAAGDVRRPNGKSGLDVPFINNEDEWTWITKVAAKNARWLGYVPFERIVDERNTPPELFVPEQEVTDWELLLGLRAPVPCMSALLSEFAATIAAIQPFRVIFVGEKVSLKPILLPIARRVGGELLLPTGEISDTQIAELAARCDADGRPAVVLYFSDFDPSGRQMPISVARKLMALRDLRYSDLRIELHHVGLTLDQAVRFNLPSTPLKESELRKDRWLERFGREQTEVDSMLALYSDELRRIAEQAVAPFYDPTLADRGDEAKNAWNEEVAKQLRGNTEFRRARVEVWRARKSVSHAVKKMGEAQERAEAALEAIQDLPDPMTPQPNLTVAAPRPLFTTVDDDFTAVHRLKAYRAYEDEDD